MRVPVGAHLEDLAVELDHLAVEPVEGAQPEVAMSLELAHRHVAGGYAFHQGVYSRGLKYGLIFVAKQPFKCLDDDRGQSLSGLLAPRPKLLCERGRKVDAECQVFRHTASLSESRGG